jgi:hypothetical protein
MNDAEFAALEDRLVGHRFPGGTFVVEDYERWLSHDAIQTGELPPPSLHPVWIVLGVLRGMGITLDDLIELAEGSLEEGVVFGETELEQLEPLAAGVTYRVHGGIKSLVRRRGRRAGVIDILTFELHITDESGKEFGVSRQAFIFRRKGVADAP